MATPVLMPQLGESVNEGTISKWLKAIGDKVEEYEPLVEVNTDKVDTEIAAPASGVLLKTLVEVGATVSSGTVLAMIGEEGESAAEAAPSAPAEPAPAAAAPTEQPAPAAEKQPEPAQAAPTPAPQPEGRDLGFISPVVARMASEHKLNLSQITGTGMGGRITKKDVLAYVEQREAQPQAAPAQPAAPAKPAPAAQPAAAVSGKLESDLVPHTNLRRLIAEHMVHSKHTSPHVTTVMESDLSRVMQHRAANKEAFAKDGVNLTFTAYFISAIVSALKAYPIVNSSWSDEGILVHRQINIGMATSLGEDGLIVPVIKQADSLSLLGLARSINDLANRARARKLQPDEVKDGTFTITNHGISGSLFASPVINQPQCAILGTGAIQKRAMVISDEKLGDVIAIRPMVYVSLTFDHRILDGASADNFLAKVVESLNTY